MAAPGGVLVTGNLVADILVRPVAGIPWGATALVDSIEQHMGGNGANTSYTLAKLGSRVRLVGMVGCDRGGDFILDTLREAGVDTSSIRRSHAGTAASVSLVNAAGERGLLHAPGASGEMETGPQEFAREAADGFQHYHAASPFGLPRLRRHLPALLQCARAAGLSTSIDTHWDSAGQWLQDLGPALPYTDILFVNEDEARMLCGTADPDIAGDILRERGAGMVVLKLGARGCIIRADVRVALAAYPVPAVDTTGAGDCFAGGFLAARLRGKTVIEAAQFANAVGAMSVQHIGATSGVTTWCETEQWIRSRAAPVHCS
jgi:sugar/nucleoside kinase (ribokinase family)